MIKIVQVNEHKDFKIHYDDKQFYALKGKNKEKFYTASSEKVVMESIDADQQKKNLKKAKITLDGLEFKQFVQSSNEFLSEGHLYFEKGVLRIIGMDPANIALIKRTVKYKGSLDFWEVGVNLNNLHSFLKRAYKRGMFKLDKITLRFDMEGDTFYMFLGNEFGEIRFPTLELEEKEAKVPTLKHAVTFSMQLSEFKKYVEMCDIVAESVTFFVKNNAFGVRAEGDLTRYNKEGIIKVKADDCESKYSIEYLRKIFFYTDNIQVNFHKDFPLKLVDDDGNTFILAPRVEND